VLSHEAQPWHYGLHPCQTHRTTLDYDSLASLIRPDKSKLLSVISSNKSDTEGHRQRLRFVNALKAAFGDQIDVFGRGIRDVADKADAIWNYKYHIVLENDHSPYYMSEKLPDAFLGWSFPFYSGGLFADEVFSEQTFSRIDMYSPDRSIATIQNRIKSNAFETAIPLLKESREKVLNDLNIFSVLCKHMNQCLERRPVRTREANPSNQLQPWITLWPKKRFLRLTLNQFARVITNAA